MLQIDRRRTPHDRLPAIDRVFAVSAGKIDALEARYPTLRGTIRDNATKIRRPYIRFFACQKDLSHDSPDAPLPEAVTAGSEPFLIVGAIAGG